MSAAEQNITTEQEAQMVPELHPATGPVSSTEPQANSRSVAIVTCSTRPSRIGPLVTDWVTSVLTPLLPSGYNLTLIDLAKLSPPLPFLNESLIPAQLPKDDPTPHYEHAHSRAWSAQVRSHDAFIFVTPQYNWGYPATIKNALDYLYHEWAAKPAMVVGYGGRGANLARDQLAQILKSLHMRVVETMPGLRISVPENGQAVDDGHFPQSRIDLWEKEGVDGQLEMAMNEMQTLLEEI